MKRIPAALITIPLRGVTFHFRVPSAAEVPALMRLEQVLRPEGRAPELEDVGRANAAILGLLWETGPEDAASVGALDAAAQRPAAGIDAPPAELLDFGDAVLAEVSEAGLSFGDLQVLVIQLLREMMGTSQIQEAMKAADFTPRR